jgi:hypothetical protein
MNSTSATSCWLRSTWNYIGEPATYVYRHALLTRIQVLSRSGRFAEALGDAQIAVDLGKAAEDILFSHLAFAKAQLLVALSDPASAITILDGVALSVVLQPPDVYALYEGVLRAPPLLREFAAARTHFERARRIMEH